MKQVMVNKLLRNPLSYILLVSPLVLYLLCMILPVHDDWSYFTTPFFEFGYDFVDRILPYWSYWRPFDGLLGYVLSLYHDLFPTLNHCLIYTGHLISTFMIYKLSYIFRFGVMARNMATIFYFISPAMLGTVLGIDSMNQVYSQMWGLVGLWVYFELRGTKRVALWLVCVSLATFSKENGIMFFVIPQILAYTSGRIRTKRVLIDTLYASLVIICYIGLRLLLSNDNVIYNPEYVELTVARYLKNIFVFIGLSWIPLDYVSLAYAPRRNFLLVLVTLVLAFPFIVYIFVENKKNIMTWGVWRFLLCMFIAAAPHLITLLTTMHPYSSLGMSSLLVGFLVNNLPREKRRKVSTLFILFSFTCAFIDCHHWYMSVQSGLVGKRMGIEAMHKIGTPVDSVYSISIDRGERQYSSFCAIPRDAYGWGMSLYAATGCKWPKTYLDTLIDQKDANIIDSLANNAINKGFKKVLIIHGDTIDVLR